MIRNAKPSSYATLPRAGAVLALCALLSACAVGPDYQRPALDVGAAYKAVSYTHLTLPTILLV